MIVLMKKLIIIIHKFLYYNKIFAHFADKYTHYYVIG